MVSGEIERDAEAVAGTVVGGLEPDGGLELLGRPLRSIEGDQQLAVAAAALVSAKPISGAAASGSMAWARR